VYAFKVAPASDIRHVTLSNANLRKGELTFSKRFGFVETGQDIDNMMFHTANLMNYTDVVRTTQLPLSSPQSDPYL
jgi:hypothetical protein